MRKSTPVVIEPLGPHHDRAAFSCGVETLDKYLRDRAGQDERRNLARTFVAVGREPHVVAGYYTLSTLGIDVGDLPLELSRQLPRYPQLPAALIGRLAVNRPYQGKGLGEMLLVDALKRVIEHGDAIACYAVVVDALDERAASFYERYGFQGFPSRPDRLFLPVATARKLF